MAGWTERGLRRRLQLYLRALREEGPPGGATVLDLGCGPGTYCRTLRRLGYRVVGLDYAREVLQRAAERCQGVPLVQAEAYRLPFRDGSFDHLLCIGVLQSLRDERRALAEMRRALRPGGWLALMTLNSLCISRFLPSRADKRAYHPFSLCGLLRELGFRRLRLRGLYLFPPPLRPLERLLDASGWFLPPLAHAFLVTGLAP